MTAGGERARGRSATIAEFVERAFRVLEEVDYYQILGLPHDAPADAVRAAYYRLAQSLHPDTHGDEVEPAFKQKLTSVYSRVVEAYRVLSDPSQRVPYDTGLVAGEHRLATGLRLKVKPEDAIGDPGARRFYLLGAQALISRDPKSAVMNLTMALSREPASRVIADALADAEAMLKAAG